MKVTPLRVPEIVLIEPRIFADARGYFLETHHAERYREAGIDAVFVQDNVAFSRGGVIRGLHYQHPNEQGKLIIVLSGEVLDVAVDIRRGSPTFGAWVSTSLSEHRQIYIPPGFAHGYCVTSESALVAYKCTTKYAAADEGAVLYCDPDLGIDWPVAEPLVSDKDRSAPRLRDIDPARLPVF